MSRKVILLIGSSGGVGSQIATDLAEMGYDLALHYHSNAEAANQLKAGVEKNGATAALFQADIGRPEEVKKLVQAVQQRFNRIDVLVNNAGISKNGMSWKLSDADWQDTMDVNLTGPFYCIREVVPVMRTQNFGRIINITSIVAQTGFPGTVAYAASKAGLIGMTKTLAKELAGKNITANCLALGYFKAGMLYTIPEEIRTTIENSIPVKSFGDTRTISSTLRFLISDEAGYLTGQTLNLNGGLH